MIHRLLHGHRYRRGLVLGRFMRQGYHSVCLDCIR